MQFPLETISTDFKSYHSLEREGEKSLFHEHFSGLWKMGRDLTWLGICSNSTPEGWVIEKEMGRLIAIIHDMAVFVMISKENVHVIEQEKY